MSRDWDQIGVLAQLAHEIDQAIPWPPALSDQLDMWEDGSIEPRQCLHFETSPGPFYGLAHQPRVLLCGACFRAWEAGLPIIIPCQVCGQPCARTWINGGYLSIATYLCPDCLHHQPRKDHNHE